MHCERMTALTRRPAYTGSMRNAALYIYVRCGGSCLDMWPTMRVSARVWKGNGVGATGHPLRMADNTSMVREGRTMAKAEKKIVAPVTFTQADMDAIIARERAAAVEAFKASKVDARNARKTPGLNKGVVDPSTSADFNTLAKCVFVADEGVIDGAVVFSRSGGFRVSAAIGGCFGVQGDTATGQTISEALDALSESIVAKAAAFADEMRAYLEDAATAAVKSGRTYRERPKSGK